MIWWRLRKVDDELNDLPDWEINENEYAADKEGVHYYDGQILGADVLAETFEKAKERATFLEGEFLDGL